VWEQGVMRVNKTENASSPHHAEGLVDPNLMYKKTVTAFEYPRACRFRKYQFENRSCIRHWTYPFFEDIISYPISRPKK
jgi:hypothetical protein